MRILTLALLIPITACAAGNDWPSLARRPGESAPLPATALEPAPIASVSASTVSSVVSSRIAEAARDLVAVRKRWDGQQAATAMAVAAARGAADSSEVAVKAQLEISRFERVGAQIGDLRARLDAISGDLALGAAEGRDSRDTLRELGALIAKVEALRAEHQAAMNRVRNK